MLHMEDDDFPRNGKPPIALARFVLAGWLSLRLPSDFWGGVGRAIEVISCANCYSIHSMTASRPLKESEKKANTVEGFFLFEALKDGQKIMGKHANYVIIIDRHPSRAIENTLTEKRVFIKHRKRNVCWLSWYNTLENTELRNQKVQMFVLLLSPKLEDAFSETWLASQTPSAQKVDFYTKSTFETVLRDDDSFPHFSR